MDDFLDLVDAAPTVDIGISLEELGRLNQTVELLREMQERCMQQRAAVKATLVVAPGPEPAPSEVTPGPTDDDDPRLEDDGAKPKQHTGGITTFADLEEAWEREEAKSAGD